MVTKAEAVQSELLDNRTSRPHLSRTSFTSSWSKTSLQDLKIALCSIAVLHVFKANVGTLVGF